MSLLKNILGGLWLAYVIGWYLPSHEYYGTGLFFWKSFLGLLVIWGLVIGGILFLSRAKKHLRITPLKGILFALLMTWLTGTFIYSAINPAVFNSPFQMVFQEGGNIALVEEGAELSPGVVPGITRGSTVLDWSHGKDALPETLQELFLTKSIPAFSLSLAFTLIKVMSFWVVLTCLFFTVGATASRQKEWNALRFFQSIGIGMGISMAGLFMLGVLGIMTQLSVKVWIVLLAMFGIRRLKFLLVSLKKSHAMVEISKKNWWVVPVFAMVGLFLSLNIVDAIAPFPVGFDSLTRYHNTPNLLLHYGQLISGIPIYNFELIISLGQFVVGGALWGMQISQWANLMALALLFVLISKYRGGEVALGILALFISLPMVNFLMSIDLKIDLPLLFFSLLAIEATIEWAKQKAHPKQAKKSLLYLGLWLGIAFGIKFTTVNLVIAIFAFMATVLWGAIGLVSVVAAGLVALGGMNYLLPITSLENSIQQMILVGLVLVACVAFGTLIKQGKANKQLLSSFVIPSGVIIVLLAPWFIFNGLQAHSLHPKDLLTGKSETVQLSAEEFGVDEDACVDAFEYDEFELYTGDKDRSLKTTLGILWESSINSNLKNNRITDIGFWFLGFAVFALFAWPELRKEDPKLRKVAGFTLLYGALWLVTSNGIIWYGMPLLLGLLLIYEKAWRTEKWTYVVLAIWLVMSLSFRYSDTVNQSGKLLFAGGLMDDALYVSQTIPGADDVAAVVNTEEALGKNIYMAGRFLDYHILENDRRIVRDQLLNKFMCVFMDDDPQVTLDRLHEKNFGYILITNDSMSVEADPNGPLHQQFEDFKQFADKYFTRVVYRPTMALYQIP